MRRFIFSFTGILTVFSLLLMSCEKENVGDDNNITTDTLETTLNEQAAKDAVSSVSAFSDVISMVVLNSDKEEQDSKKSSQNGCPTVDFSRELLTYPKTLVVDFGTDCDHFGVNISGNIFTELSGGIRQEGTELTVTFTDFAIDTLQLKGTFTLTVNEAKVSTDGYVVLSVDMSGAEIIFPNRTLTTTSSMNVRWTLNALTDFNDDTIEITALSGDFSNDSYDFSVSLIKTLLVAQECKEIVSGEIQVQESDAQQPANVDFGDGECDGLATVSTIIVKEIGGEIIEQPITFDIPLP